MNTCGRCGRPLRSARSRKLGFGEACWTKVLAELRAGEDVFSARQLGDAREVIEQGGVIYYRRGVYMVVSTDGTQVHRTTRDRCTCWAGLAGRLCYHTAAAVRALGGR
jgi:hypothetical protein